MINENFCSKICGFKINLVKAAIGLASLEIVGRFFFLFLDFHREFKYAILYYHAEILMQFLFVLMSLIVPLQLIYGALKVRRIKIDLKNISTKIFSQTNRCWSHG